jgi:hypothetical protein
MAVEDYLRLAWHANREGRSGMRDALLTLAVAESGPDNAVLAERCRKRLVAGRPEHWYASFPTLGEALSHPRVVEALAEIRTVYPPARVRHMLLRLDALRGPLSRHPRPLGRVVDDLVNVEPNPGRAAAYGTVPAAEQLVADPGIGSFYLTVLLAMAALLAVVQKPAAHEKAA